MSNYVAYSYQQPQMMNTYQPNNYQVPIQNSYMDRMAQLQQYQQNMQMLPTPMSATSQAQQPQGIIGRVVNDFNEITANDVPMNGSAAFFPKADGSEMQVRSWTPNGTIQTVIYKPIQAENSVDGTNPQMDFNVLNEDMKALREDIKDIKEMIGKSMNIPVPKAMTSRGKKEADE